jgi:hypothetical protein
VSVGGRRHAATLALALVMVIASGGIAHAMDEILFRTPGGVDVIALRLGPGGPAATRRGALRSDPAGERLDAADVEWRLPAGDAVYLRDEWWSPLAPLDLPASRDPDPAAIAAIRGGIAPADDGRGRDRLYQARLGDVDADGRDDLVVAFRRPFQRTFINMTRPARAWRDAAGMSAHVGVYDPATIRPRWVAGTLVRPVVDIAVCDGAVAVAYGRLDRRGVVETGAWRWQGFGFIVSEPLAGGGEPACVDVDGDGRSEPAIVGREGS